MREDRHLALALRRPVTAQLLVPSLTNGYPHSLVHLYQCLVNAARLGLSGAVAEFGMFKGGTTMFLSKVIERLGASWPVIGFDTFGGFPPRRPVVPPARNRGVLPPADYAGGGLVKRPPVPRPRIYDLYWYFASERQRMFARRVAGDPGPWTDDPILREFKFCNVFRAADRVSQYMIRDVCYHDEPCTDEDRLFQIVAFRTFSKTATWRTARDFLGRYPVLDDLADGALPSALDHARTSNGGLYTGAFILCATDAYGQSAKHRNHVELFRHMFLHDQLGAKLLETKSLREVYELLHGYPLMGDFMSYQTTIDLNYSALLDFSENEFTQAGPGALRGIKKCFEDLGDYTPAEIVLWMTERQDEEFADLACHSAGCGGGRCTPSTARACSARPTNTAGKPPRAGQRP